MCFTAYISIEGQVRKHVVLALVLQGAPGSSGGSSMFLPQGAIGVFDLPSHWAVVQQNAHTDEPIIDT